MKALKLYFILSFLVIGTVVLDGQDLVILHTNDTHSQITPQTSGDGAGLGGYERREAYVNSVRSEMGADKVLLLDAGDFSQGTPYFFCCSPLSVHVTAADRISASWSGAESEWTPHGTPLRAGRLKS